MKICINVNSVRHWVAICRGKEPDDPKIKNAAIAKLTAAQIEPLFAPLRFLGWRRHRAGNIIVSRLAKDRSNDFMFESDEPGELAYWSLDQIHAYIGTRSATPGVGEAPVPTPSAADRAAARAALKKFRRDTDEISIIAMTKTKALRVLPDEIGQFTKLDSLVLHNHLFETLPDTIGKLTSLTHLEVNGGRLGRLPAAIGKLVNLESLILDWTEITTLPEEIGALGKLQTLSLDSCMGLVSLPASLARCTALTSVHLTHVARRKELAAQVKKWLPRTNVHALP